ncbi:hypothetical protein GGG16DRAFT_91161 [Schizophyllum commune]
MSQWGQGQPGYQYPMQTGYNPGMNPQFQANQPPQFQQNPQFQQPQQTGYTGGILPQQTGFPQQQQRLAPQPTGYQGGLQAQPTGYQGALQAQPTGYQGSALGHRAAPPPPPVPPIPSQFQNQTSQLGVGQPNRFLNTTPLAAQPTGFPGLSAQPTGFQGLSAQPTGFQAARPLVPQATGFVDPRLQMMSSTFMPLNPSVPYGAGGAPQLPSQSIDGSNLQQSFQQYNQEQRGTAAPKVPWALSKAEKKQYDQIFRAWDTGNTGFINGQTALEVFGQSGLSKEELGRIWALADVDDRGKLNIAEFHVAMGLIYRRLNGNPIPDTLPPELVPPSAKDLDTSVNFLKDVLKNETRSTSALDGPDSRLKQRSLHSNSSAFADRDATVYRHTESESPAGGFYQPRNRHRDSPSADLDDMKRTLNRTQQMLDRSSEKNQEDMLLDEEMEDLKHKVKRLNEDLEYASRGVRTQKKDEERRRLERELMVLMHEEIPELERRIKDRDERKEREKREWIRNRDRANQGSGRYRDRDDSYGRDYESRPYSRGANRDYESRPYSRGGDRDYEPRPYSRGGGDYESRPYSRGPDYERDRPYSRGGYRRSPSPSRETDRAAPPPPAAEPAGLRAPPTAPKPPTSPAPALKNMTPEERRAHAQAEAQKRIQARMAALGVTAPSTSASPALDTSVEDRLQKEKQEAEEKAKAAEAEAAERERVRRERLENEKALRDGRDTPASATVTSPTSAAPAPPTPITSSGGKAPPPPAPKRGPAPPPPAKRGPPKPPAAPAVRAPPPPAAPPAPAAPEVDPEEEALRQKEEAARKKREERERRLRELEEQERLEEQRYEERMRKLKEEAEAKRKAEEAKAAAPAATSPPPTPPAPPAPPAPAAPTPASPPAAEKSTNPFSRLMQGGGAPPAAPPVANGAASTNPWSRPAAASPAAAAAPTPPAFTPAPPRSPAPTSSPAPPAVKTTYMTVPADDDSDWDEVKEKTDDEDSSDDDFADRNVRKNIAQSLFGNVLPRSPSVPPSGGSTPVTAHPPASIASPPPAPPAPPAAPPAPPALAAPPAPAADGGAPPPPPPPPGPPAPPPPPMAAPAAAPPAGGAGRGALLASIQSGARLRKVQTVDKSGPQVSGQVLGDTAPPPHISAAPRMPSPPPPPAPEPEPMQRDNSNRQSVDWYAGLAADVGTPQVDKMPSFAEEQEEPASVPDIQVHDAAPSGAPDPLADIDKSTELRVRTLYPFEAFGENLILKANPSKTGGDWWYGTLVRDGKAGLFPKTYVAEFTSFKAKAIYDYTGGSEDELPFAAGDEIDIIDRSDEEWWKTEKNGVVFIVPAAYFEEVQDGSVSDPPPASALPEPTQANHTPSITTTEAPADASGPAAPAAQAEEVEWDSSGESDADSTDYFSLEDSDEEEETSDTKEDRAAREAERQRVLEAAGLVVQRDKPPPPRPPRRKRSVKQRRPAPAAPKRASVLSVTSDKDLPTLPTESTAPISRPMRLDDAYERYEEFKSKNRMSMSSMSDVPSSPTSASITPGAVSPAPSIARDDSTRSHSRFLSHILGRSKTPDRIMPVISGPILQTPEVPDRPNSPAFGSSWASLVDKTALDGIPPHERKRQEAIFELIATESAYVHDLQLIVEVFYQSMLPLLDTKAITVVFANVEDLLLVNTTFMSSLEQRQKECRLYVDRIGDILDTHMSNMAVYMEYCVNQSNAIKVLQTLREGNPQLAEHLQRLRDTEPACRNLDLSSYLLSPMQRITRYPLLLRQVLHYTEPNTDEHRSIDCAVHVAERILNHINETIREQEGREKLRMLSEHLWIGQGRLDLTAPTRHMGTRRLLKEGFLMKAKSGRRLYGVLCSDIMVLTDEHMKTLYRMPPLPASPSPTTQGLTPLPSDDGAFQISLPYPRGGDTIALRAGSLKECQQWIDAIELATLRARDAEKRALRRIQTH